MFLLWSLQAGGGEGGLQPGGEDPADSRGQNRRHRLQKLHQLGVRTYKGAVWLIASAPGCLSGSQDFEFGISRFVVGLPPEMVFRRRPSSVDGDRGFQVHIKANLKKDIRREAVIGGTPGGKWGKVNMP